MVGESWTTVLACCVAIAGSTNALRNSALTLRGALHDDPLRAFRSVFAHDYSQTAAAFPSFAGKLLHSQFAANEPPPHAATDLKQERLEVSEVIIDKASDFSGEHFLAAPQHSTILFPTFLL
jgi:hypothetical protein